MITIVVWEEENPKWAHWPCRHLKTQPSWKRSRASPYHPLKLEAKIIFIRHEASSLRYFAIATENEQKQLPTRCLDELCFRLVKNWCFLPPRSKLHTTLSGPGAVSVHFLISS